MLEAYQVWRGAKFLGTVFLSKALLQHWPVRDRFVTFENYMWEGSMPPKNFHELRVAVGTPDGLRSTVWKFVVRGSDIYIFTRMFGGEAKVSLHASGECQWSRTGSWVRKDGSRKNAERHFNKWRMPKQMGHEAVLIFNIKIPESELRMVDAPESLGKVLWIDPPKAGKTLSMDCFITPISSVDPTIVSPIPAPCVTAFPLADGRWFVVLRKELDLDGAELQWIRAEMKRKCAEEKLDLNHKQRGVAFSTLEKYARSLIEICAVARPAE